jgi:hypothetical protein
LIIDFHFKFKTPKPLHEWYRHSFCFLPGILLVKIIGTSTILNPFLKALNFISIWNPYPFNLHYPNQFLPKLSWKTNKTCRCIMNRKPKTNLTYFEAK